MPGRLSRFTGAPAADAHLVEGEQRPRLREDLDPGVLGVLALQGGDGVGHLRVPLRVRRLDHAGFGVDADPLGLAPAIDPALVEYDLGDWEGLTYRHLHEEKRLFENMKRDPDYAPHGGESPRDVGLRLASALESIARRHPGELVRCAKALYKAQHHIGA